MGALWLLQDAVLPALAQHMIGLGDKRSAAARSRVVTAHRCDKAFACSFTQTRGAVTVGGSLQTNTLQMRERCRRAGVTMALALVLLAVATACGERTSAGRSQGQLFPVVPLLSLTGKDVLTDQAPCGKARVVNFWATWCEPCRTEMSSLQRLHQLADPAKLSVLGVSVDTDLNLAREFLLQQGLTFRNYSDSEQKLARNALGVRAFPATFLVAANGAVIARITGARDWASPDMLRFLSQALDTPLVENYSAHP